MMFIYATISVYKFLISTLPFLGEARVQVQTYAQIHHAHALSIHVQREQRRNTGQLGHITVDNREVSITIVRIHRVLRQSA
jgi:hypothetical protein